MISVTQPRASRRAVTLDPFELGAASRQMLETASQPDVGCVDWYLYPVTKRVGPTADARSAPRISGAAPV